MYKHEKYPYGCIELESSKGLLKESNLEWLSDSYSKADIVEKSGEIFKHIRNNISDKEKKVWALLGGEKKNKWICLQVASANNIQKEIISDIKCMLPLKKDDRKQWSSKFHSNIFKVQYGMDVRCQKYRDMCEHFDFFRIIVINPEEYIKGNNNGEFDLIKYTEVKFAYETKALYWNPFNEEHKILEVIKNENK